MYCIFVTNVVVVMDVGKFSIVNFVPQERILLIKTFYAYEKIN